MHAHTYMLWFLLLLVVRFQNVGHKHCVRGHTQHHSECGKSRGRVETLTCTKSRIRCHHPYAKTSHRGATLLCKLRPEIYTSTIPGPPYTRAVTPPLRCISSTEAGYDSRGSDLSVWGGASEPYPQSHNPMPMKLPRYVRAPRVPKEVSGATLLQQHHVPTTPCWTSWSDTGPGVPVLIDSNYII